MDTILIWIFFVIKEKMYEGFQKNLLSAKKSQESICLQLCLYSGSMPSWFLQVLLLHRLCHYSLLR